MTTFAEKLSVPKNYLMLIAGLVWTFAGLTGRWPVVEWCGDGCILSRASPSYKETCHAGATERGATWRIVIASVTAVTEESTPMADDWFRGPDWTLADRDEYERRLSRARPNNRGQYLRIKGLALAEVGRVDDARALWQRVLADPGYQMERWATLEHLADAAVQDAPEEAGRLYRILLAENPTLNATTHMAEVRLAELCIAQGSPESLAEADALLVAWKENRSSPFPVNHFQWEVALARLGLAMGDVVAARDAARRALHYAEAAAPFPRHPGFGVVRADDGVLAWLTSLADDEASAR